MKMTRTKGAQVGLEKRDGLRIPLFSKPTCSCCSHPRYHFLGLIRPTSPYFSFLGPTHWSCYYLGGSNLRLIRTYVTVSPLRSISVPADAIHATLVFALSGPEAPRPPFQSYLALLLPSTPFSTRAHSALHLHSPIHKPASFRHSSLQLPHLHHLNQQESPKPFR